MPDCLTDETLARFLSERLAEEELTKMHEHMDDCPDCHSRVVELVRRSAWVPPDTFNEFQRIRLLGRGAMGDVYLARDTQLQRLVAVKFIAARHPEDQEGFDEAQAIAQLRHPNVVIVFRKDRIDNHCYIVTEYLEGQTLDKLTLPMSWRRALELGVGLARGLKAAHAVGMLHRDIKPSNIFLTDSGEVKLIDFGLAEIVNPAAPSEPGLARTLAGTRPYMAPELFQGSLASPRTDLYALGVVLFQLCTRQLPASALPSLTQLVPGIAPDFALLIQCCLQCDPNKRYVSAEALCDELERIHVPEVRWAGNPYRGLAPFDVQHRALFFGRNADIKNVLDLLSLQPLVLIAGDSGVGKSSLCRAGLLPRISQEVLGLPIHFEPKLQPGRHPLKSLAAALAPVLQMPEDELGTRLSEQPGWLGPKLRALRDQGRGLILFVDQLEELITLSEDDQARSFARLLGELGALNVTKSGVRVLLTVRGDFLTRVCGLLGLGPAPGRAIFLLQPLTGKGVQEAIEDPARRRGVTFETAALQALLKAMAQGSGSLPLLQFALTELWERRDPVGGRITQASLESMGGVEGALSRHADAVLAPLSEAGRRTVRHLLGLLITAEETLGERSEEALLAVAPEAGAALRALVEGRLLRAYLVGDRAHYKLAHEALITGWGTLRHWLDEDVGQRPLRQRLERASVEWERMGHPEELLWRLRQVEEARALSPSTLGSREQAFLQASWRAVRRRKSRRRLAVLLAVLLVGCSYGVPRFLVHQETRSKVTKLRIDARDALVRGRESSQRASVARELALALFDGGSETSGTQSDLHQRWVEAERLWQEALRAFRSADAAHTAAARDLDDCLTLVGDDPETHELRVQLASERLLLTERFHREEAGIFLQELQRLTAGDEALRNQFDTAAGLELQTTPPGATVELSRYQKSAGVWQLDPVKYPSLPGKTPLSLPSLEAGSYRLRFTLKDRPPVDLPILLERGRTEQLQLDLPSSVPEGFVYIPPGCFLMGSNDSEEVRDFMRSAPMHKRCMSKGYLMGRYEVTLLDWITYLNKEATKEERALLTEETFSSWGAFRLWWENGFWRFSLKLSDGTQVPTVREGELLRYPERTLRQEQDWRQFPLAGITPEKAKGFLSWLSRTKTLPGARLCDELEWVRAARGADDRRYPHGSRLEPDDANFDETYGRQPKNFGPDEVRAHPVAVSPFGIHEMAGNVSELVVSPGADLGEHIVLGGAWYFERIVAFIPNRQAYTAAARDVTVGLRLCASWPPP